MTRRSWIIDGIDRMYRVECVEDVDAIIAEMLKVPVEERGDRFQDEIDCLLDGRNRIDLEVRM